MTGDAEQEYFVDGMVEEITTAISRLPWLFVIARNSSFAYKGQSPDIRQVGRELGVRYVLEGSVRKAGNRIRITGQLIDATTGVHIWADRIDGALDDIFELQDQVAARVAGAIEPKLRVAEIERANQKSRESLDAYDLYLRGLAEFNTFSKEGLNAAARLLRQALTISPTYAPAAALIGMCRVIQRTNAWIPAEGSEVTEAVQLARRALEISRDDPDVLWAASYTLASIAQEHRAAAHGIDRALLLNPNSAHAWMAKGLVSCFLERYEAGIEHLERAMRLSPLDPLSYVFAVGLAVAYSGLDRYEEALEWAERSLRDHPNYVAARRIKVVLLVYLNRVDEAREALRQLLELVPGLTIANLPQIVAGGIQSRGGARYLEAYRKAGLPEE
jgi:adenylate cyclase